MISEFLLRFVDQITVLDLFKYITVRSALAAATAFMFSLMMGPRIITMLRAWGLREKTLKGDSQTLDRLHEGKQDTPTMGGLILIAATVLAVICWGRLSESLLLVGVGVVVASGLVGFVDDWKKLKGRGGLRGSVKLLVLCMIATASSVFLVSLETAGAQYGYLHFPFFKNVIFDLGMFYPFLAVVVFAGTANAVNLTDGLDGLAIGTYLPLAAAFGVITYLTGHAIFSQYLYLPYVKGAGELTVLCSALLGSGLGFLWFNCHPAEVFMGDTGSLALGGVMGYVSLVTRQELLLVLAGGVFVVEALSVILQVSSFKSFGRRLLRCAPLHHHYEFMGVHENKIVIRFWIIGIIMAFLALLTLKVR